MKQNKTKYIARRLLALLLAGLLAFSVCGCSVSSEPAPDEKPETQTLPEIAEEAPQNETENTEEKTMSDPAKTAEDLLQAAKAYALAMPTFPAMAPYPDESLYYKGDGSFDSDGFNKAYNAWEETRRAQKSQANAYSGKLNAYLQKTAAAFLQGKEADKNAVCSPLNIWMALAMAAETAGGA
ncbi:MAG: hypothetical protein K5981_08515, partial [Clostridia bacterium]|nr:hypothetical protein [Clostridia bacterium]